MYNSADIMSSSDLAAPVDPIEFFDGNDRVLALMNMRRKGPDDMSAERSQQRADEIKAALCNKIQELMRSVPNLRDRIVAISEIDPELSAYIMALESINSGIWCPKCKTVKRFGGEMTSGVGVDSTVHSSVHSSHDSLEISKLQAHLRTAREELGLLTSENNAMKNRMDLITIKLDSYNKRLNMLSEGKSVHSQVAKSAETVVKYAETLAKSAETVLQPPARVRHALLDLKKEDLPPAPEFDIVFTFGEDSSADSLLE
jgi:hypothetical protein